MELNNLSPEQVTELKDKLSALSKKHFLASGSYIPMNEEEADEYAQSEHASVNSLDCIGMVAA
jgi:hypothetical protein